MESRRNLYARSYTNGRIKMKAHIIIALSILFCACSSQEQKLVNDTNTPLHLLVPEYKIPYRIPSVSNIKRDIDRVLNYIDSNTPTRLVDKKSGEEITDNSTISSEAQIERGAFRLASYEWGVTYSAMLTAFEVTGDSAYINYVTQRFDFIAAIAPLFQKLITEGKQIDPQMQQILTPKALDDAGAVCTAMIKAKLKDSSLNLDALIENYMDFILNKEYRLADGTFARTRPQYNSVWLDDMFMGIPPIVYYSKYAEQEQDKYISEAVKQVLQFSDRMWVAEKKLFRHGWVESMTDHPAFFWGRANGWALLTICEVLDVLPEDHAEREKILNLLQEHIRGLASLQSGDGFWHQLLDREDSYLETSATAIYVYCIAHAINNGWIDAQAYGAVALLGWNAVSTKINSIGQVEGTCVGTGMGFDPAFYYYRPVNSSAAHGYGPVIWAGAEIITLLNGQHPKMNDSAVQFYPNEQTSEEPIFYVSQP